MRLEPFEQPLRRFGDFVDRAIEHDLILLRRTRRATHLTHILKSCGSDLFFGCGRLEVEQYADVSAHGRTSNSTMTQREAPARICESPFRAPKLKRDLFTSSVFE